MIPRAQPERLTFEDGATGLVDFSGERWSGDMASLADPDDFEQVFIQPQIGTVVWPNGAEIVCGGSIRESATGFRSPDKLGTKGPSATNRPQDCLRGE